MSFTLRASVLVVSFMQRQMLFQDFRPRIAMIIWHQWENKIVRANVDCQEFESEFTKPSDPCFLAFVIGLSIARYLRTYMAAFGVCIRHCSYFFFLFVLSICAHIYVKYHGKIVVL